MPRGKSGEGLKRRWIDYNIKQEQREEAQEVGPRAAEATKSSEERHKKWGQERRGLTRPGDAA